VNSGLTDQYIKSLAVSGSNLFAGTGNGVFISTNNGTSWTKPNATYVDAESFAMSGTNLFAGGYYGVFLSTNNGTSWSAVNSGLTDQYIKSLAVSGSNLFAGTESGVFLSTNNGTNWTAVNSGLTNSHVLSLAVSGTNLFVGTGGGVFRRSLSDMITSIESFSTGMPGHFNLEQNYPNPFNPTTTIKYSLPQQTFVSLSIYDLLGREIVILVNEEKDAGTHSIKFNGSNLSSGIYLYRIQSGSFWETKKLILIK
jgi:hypothetical protein